MSADSSANATPEAELADVIARAKRELQMMIDLNPSAMLLVDAGGCIARCNRALLVLLGVNQFSAVLGKPLADALPGMEAAALARLIQGGDFEEAEGAVALADGRQRQLHFDAVALGGGSSSRVLIVEDVTEVRAAEVETEHEHKREAVRALIGALMHHLNQRLTVISVRARMMLMALQDGRLDPKETATFLEDMVENAMKMAGLLRRVYDAEDYVTQEYIEGLQILKIDDPA